MEPPKSSPVLKTRQYSLIILIGVGIGICVTLLLGFLLYGTGVLGRWFVPCPAATPTLVRPTQTISIATSTPEPSVELPRMAVYAMEEGGALFTIADNCRLVLRIGARIEPVKPQEGLVNFLQGEALVISEEDCSSLTFALCKDVKLFLSPNETTVVGITRNGDQVDIDCLTGSCWVEGLRENIELSAGEHVRLEECVLATQDSARYEEWSDLAELGSVVTPTPSATTVTETPDVGATATVACQEFEDQFPGTPCP